MHCKAEFPGGFPYIFCFSLAELAVAEEGTHILFFYISVNMASQAVPADVQDTPIPTALQADERLTERKSSTAMTSKVLDAVPDLPRLFRLVLKRVAWQWERLATMLELDNDGRKIDAIKRDFWGVGVEICCMQAIHHWVRGEGKAPVSWRTLLKCLEDMECAQVAEEIAKQLAGEFAIMWKLYIIGEGGRDREGREREREGGR